MKIDKTSETPLYQQIYDSIAEEIAQGYLSVEDRLPSRRALCKELGVSPQTVESAYARLAADGYITARKGSGYYVSSERVWDEEHKEMKSLVYNFSSNGVETSKMPFEEWSRLVRSTIREDTGLFQHGEKAGEWCLRKSIRRLLFRTRGIECKTEQIIIGPGAEDLLRSVFDIFARDSKVLLHNCYNYRVHAAAEEVHSDIEYLSDDENGVNEDELSKFNSGVLYQKPEHYLPTGVRLSNEQRESIAKWLGDERYIVEDAGEAEFVYGESAKTFWEISGGKNVIYLGSFSGTIAPSMKIGYVVMPQELVDRWFKERVYYSNRVSRIEQVTLSKFIDNGYYERHIGYMKDVYRAKTETAKRAIEQSSLGKSVKLSGYGAGTFFTARLETDKDEIELVRYFRNNGVKFALLSSSCKDIARHGFAANTYIVGYGEMTATQIREGIEKWSKLWDRYENGRIGMA